MVIWRREELLLHVAVWWVYGRGALKMLPGVNPWQLIFIYRLRRSMGDHSHPFNQL
jgi:hypothetical protein